MVTCATPSSLVENASGVGTHGWLLAPEHVHGRDDASFRGADVQRVLGPRPELVVRPIDAEAEVHLPPRARIRDTMVSRESATASNRPCRTELSVTVNAPER